MGTVPSTVAGNPCPVLSPVPSATSLYCAVVRLTLREWLDALIGCDVLLGKSVETEATRLLPSPASGESENWYPIRGIAGRGLGGAEGFGLSSEASAQASDESENR